jgi:hypothetical protein
VAVAVGAVAVAALAVAVGAVVVAATAYLWVCCSVVSEQDHHCLLVLLLRLIQLALYQWMLQRRGEEKGGVKSDERLGREI